MVFLLLNLIITVRKYQYLGGGKEGRDSDLMLAGHIRLQELIVLFFLKILDLCLEMNKMKIGEELRDL